MTETIHIKKASGESEPFDESKLRQSLKRVRAPQGLAEEILGHIRQELRDGMTTAEIYRRAFKLLHCHEKVAASHYSIKKAVMELGPTGYPFEKITGEILKSRGYKVEIGAHFEGYCVNHEVDVLARNNDLLIVECKFHNRPGYKTDVKVALYVKARFDDIKKTMDRRLNQRLQAWLVTNTRLTKDAIQYSKCAGIKAIGWDYPARDNLQQLIEKSGLLPVTSLTSINKSRKKQLIKEGIITCAELARNIDSLYSIGLSEREISKVLREVEDLRKSLDLL